MDEMVPAGRLRPAPWSQTVPDEILALKMAKLVRRWGQLAPVVVRTAEDGALEIIHGRRLYEAVKAISADGKGLVKVANVGHLADPDAKALAFALHTMSHETDYATVATLVADAIDSGLHTSHDLASVSRFTQDRVEQFAKMARFDWTTLGTDEAEGPAGPTQGGLWDEPDQAAAAEVMAVEVMAAADVVVPEAAAPWPQLSAAVERMADAIDHGQAPEPEDVAVYMGIETFGGEGPPHAPAAWTGAGPHEEQGPAPVFDEAGEADLLLAAMFDEGDEL